MGLILAVLAGSGKPCGIDYVMLLDWTGRGRNSARTSLVSPELPQKGVSFLRKSTKDLDNARSKSGGESPLSEPDGTVSAIQVLHNMRQHSEAILIEKRPILILI
jgi:hypothetical protein